MAQYIEQVGYGLSEALPSLAPRPKKANRAPNSGDKGYLVGQIWVYSASNAIYILASVVNNLANWQLLSASGGDASFSSLSVSGASTLGAVTSTAGNLTLSNGNIVLTTAATKIVLPGPVSIMSGAGAPDNSLALVVGDMYINTTAASATTRLYIATAAGSWTNVTCAA